MVNNHVLNHAFHCEYKILSLKKYDFTMSNVFIMKQSQPSNVEAFDCYSVKGSRNRRYLSQPSKKTRSSLSTTNSRQDCC